MVKRTSETQWPKERRKRNGQKNVGNAIGKRTSETKWPKERRKPNGQRNVGNLVVKRTSETKWPKNVGNAMTKRTSETQWPKERRKRNGRREIQSSKTTLETIPKTNGNAMAKENFRNTQATKNPPTATTPSAQNTTLLTSAQQFKSSGPPRWTNYAPATRGTDRCCKGSLRDPPKQQRAERRPLFGGVPTTYRVVTQLQTPRLAPPKQQRAERRPLLRGFPHGTRPTATNPPTPTHNPCLCPTRPRPPKIIIGKGRAPMHAMKRSAPRCENCPASKHATAGHPPTPPQQTTTLPSQAAGLMVIPGR